MNQTIQAHKNLRKVIINLWGYQTLVDLKPRIIVIVAIESLIQVKHLLRVDQ